MCENLMIKNDGVISKKNKGGQKSLFLNLTFSWCASKAYVDCLHLCFVSFNLSINDHLEVGSQHSIKEENLGKTWESGRMLTQSMHVSDVIFF